MLKIGMDKTDITFRKFEYDDERMYGNPQKFKVLYEETGVFGEVLCSNVISIKKSNNIKNHFLDIPIYRESKKDDASKQNTTVVLSDDVHDLEKLLESKVETTEKKKTKTSTKVKLKSKSSETQTRTQEEKQKELSTTTIDTSYVFPKSYEYDILVVDNVLDVDDIKIRLNEFGKDGWDVCGFQVIQKVFCCQAIIIMKKGLN
jgi:PleD family two-component response regulator